MNGRGPGEKAGTSAAAGESPGKTAGEIVEKGSEPGSSHRPVISPEERHARILDAAHRRAEKRGFAPGHELEDWLEAEREVESEIQR